MRAGGIDTGIWVVGRLGAKDVETREKKKKHDAVRKKESTL